MAKSEKNKAPEQAAWTEQPGPVATAPEGPERTAQPGTAPESTEQAPERAAPASPAQSAPEAEAPELFALEALAEANRIPGWQSAALHKLMGWESGKKVTVNDYKAGLARLKNRRIGG
jgi:hypothetical protein